MRKNRPSRTAPKVGAAVLYVAGDPRYAALLPPGLTEETGRLLLAAGALKPWHLRLLGKRWYRRLIDGVVRWMAPGHLVYLALRKRVVQDEVEAALAGGATQVLIVGGGMDTLCLRLAPEHPRATFVEVDHPASQGMKRRAVERISGGRPNLHFVAVDLEATDLAEVLTLHPAWRSDAPTIAVAEGLLAYLAPETIDRLFAAVARATGAGSRFVFSYTLVDETGRVRLGKVMRLQGRLLATLGEALRWGLPDGGLESFLAGRGFRRLGPPERTDLGARYLEPAGLGDEPLGGIEHVALAEWRPGGAGPASPGPPAPPR